MTEPAYTGLLEGFYGRFFTMEQRAHLIDFAARSGYRFYIYAPKNDSALRVDFTRGLGNKYIDALASVADSARAKQVDFGLGLSPFNITSCYAEHKDRLLQLVRKYCERLQPEIFCLLFDDVKLTDGHMGAAQNAIVQEVYSTVCAYSCVQRFIICPSYYTFDPILDKVFGQRPEHYFTELCRGLPEQVDIFWTGNKVLSPDITRADLDKAADLLGRRPFVWDNYPVNDGKKISQYLFLKPFAGRRDLAGACRGHAVNLMNECFLNEFPLPSLPQIYAGMAQEEIDRLWQQSLQDKLGEGAQVLTAHLDMLCERGLDKLNALQKAMLIAACELEEDNPYLQDIRAFLTGEYAFDPACLTS